MTPLIRAVDGSLVTVPLALRHLPVWGGVNLGSSAYDRKAGLGSGPSIAPIVGSYTFVNRSVVPVSAGARAEHPKYRVGIRQVFRRAPSRPRDPKPRLGFGLGLRYFYRR